MTYLMSSSRRFCRCFIDSFEHFLASFLDRKNKWPRSNAINSKCANILKSIFRIIKGITGTQSAKKMQINYEINVKFITMDDAIFKAIKSKFGDMHHHKYPFDQ